MPAGARRGGRAGEEGRGDARRVGLRRGRGRRSRVPPARTLGSAAGAVAAALRRARPALRRRARAGEGARRRPARRADEGDFGSVVRIALTFDTEFPGRPTEAGVEDRLLAALAAADVRATFFLQGRWVRANPEQARRIAAAGHLIGN